MPLTTIPTKTPFRLKIATHTLLRMVNAKLMAQERLQLPPTLMSPLMIPLNCSNLSAKDPSQLPLKPTKVPSKVTKVVFSTALTAELTSTTVS